MKIGMGLFHIHLYLGFLNSTESGLGSDIFDVGAADFGRHPLNIERVRLYRLGFIMEFLFV
jgi:hypothetical protein